MTEIDLNAKWGFDPDAHPETRPFGNSPCIGSGYCCKKSPCTLYLERYGLETWVSPCPRLRYDADTDRHFCAEILDAKTAEEYSYTVRTLFVGAGCCSALNSDRLAKLNKRTTA